MSQGRGSVTGICTDRDANEVSAESQRFTSNLRPEWHPQPSLTRAVAASKNFDYCACGRTWFVECADPKARKGLTAKFTVGAAAAATAAAM